ncbi:MAG: SDR family NAD(P)-dependent oxidoreductase [Caldilineaceae bacterium]|nr:SDR family NAD(P)-dependent oxidoreductase [Caldilineaceae bacterium]
MIEIQSVFITGASTGIGKACALWMDRLGWQVFAGVRREIDGETLRRESSARLWPIHIDVTDAASIAAAADQIGSVVGDTGLHGLVNNAGVAFGGILEFMPIEHLRQQLEINVIGQVAVTQPLIPLLRRAHGRIVNMSSIAGLSATPVMGPYAASKHALEALTDSLRLELRPWGIHVAAVEPGRISTPIWQKSLAEAQKWIEAYPPLAHKLYGPLIERALRSVSKESNVSSDTVAAVVAHALTASQPRIRYVVGRDAQIRLWIERLPDTLRDRIIGSRMPTYGN